MEGELVIDEAGSFIKLDRMLMGTNCGSESAEGMIMVEVAKVEVEAVGVVVGAVEVVLIVVVVEVVLIVVVLIVVACST